MSNALTTKHSSSLVDEHKEENVLQKITHRRKKKACLTVQTVN